MFSKLNILLIYLHEYFIKLIHQTQKKMNKNSFRKTEMLFDEFSKPVQKINTKCYIMFFKINEK